MLDLMQISRNHLEAAKEHLSKSDLIHMPTIWQAIRTTLSDMIFNKTIYIKEYQAHLVYEVQKSHTLGLRIANVIRVYVPKEHRGKGIATIMYDKIKENIVIGGANDRDKYRYIGSLYVIRENL